MPDYHKGKIYKILNTIDNEIYVGSTCELLSRRMARHRYNMKSIPHLKLYKHMHELGVEHFYIELIEDCPCDRNEELVKREGEIIRSIGTLNKNGTINIKENSKGYQRQYHMQYYQDNLETRKEQKHRWYEQNKEQVKEQQQIRNKQYYEQNREQVKEQQQIRNKQYYEKNREHIKNNLVECECGCVVNYRGLTKHKQSNKHKKLFDKIN